VRDPRGRPRRADARSPRLGATRIDAEPPAMGRRGGCGAGARRGAQGAACPALAGPASLASLRAHLTLPKRALYTDFLGRFPTASAANDVRGRFDPREWSVDARDPRR